MESTSADLGSFEGKYPKDLFNKNVVAAGGQAVGHVAKETDNTIVVFSDSGDLRYDIPKSKIEVVGGSVVVSEPLDQYAVDKDVQMPLDKPLRPSAEEIIQKAGEIPEKPSVPSEVEYRASPSVVEEKAAQVADEFKGVGRELEQAARTTKEKIGDVGAVAANDMETAARQTAGRAGELARSGARSVTEKIEAAQSNTEAGLSADNVLKAEKESRQPTTELDLGSYEGKYPKDLFNKTVLVNDQLIGRVAKETDDVIVVFSDTDSTIRFDIPKSEIRLSGNSVVASEDLLFRFRTRRDAPMPPDKPLRPSGEEIRAAAAQQQQQLETQEKERITTPDAVMEEGSYLATSPRPETTGVAVPEGYVDTESELSKRLKSALSELKEVIVAGGRVAKKKAEEAKAQAEEKRADMDAESISRMGELATRFADSFEDVISEIRTRTYADQVQIYNGFIKLIDQQRNLVLAQRDLALRLADSVPVPVVDKLELQTPPELPEDIVEGKTLDEHTKATSSSSSPAASASSSSPRSRRRTSTTATSSKTTRKRKRTD